MAGPVSGLLGNKRLATHGLGYPDWGVASAVTTPIKASSPLPFVEIVGSVPTQSSNVTVRDLEGPDVFAEVTFDAITTLANVTVSEGITSYLAAIGGTVDLDGGAAEGAIVTIVDSDADTVASVVTVDSNGRFDAVVPGGPTYHVIVEYENDSGEKFNVKSKPYIDTADP